MRSSSLWLLDSEDQVTGFDLDSSSRIQAFQTKAPVIGLPISSAEADDLLLGALMAAKWKNGHVGRYTCSQEGRRIVLSPQSDVVINAGLEDPLPSETLARLPPITTERPRELLLNLDVNVGALALSYDGARLALGFATGAVRVYDLETKRLVASFNPTSAQIECLGFDAEGDVLAFADATSRVGIYHFATGGVTDVGERQTHAASLLPIPKRGVVLLGAYMESSLGIINTKE